MRKNDLLRAIRDAKTHQELNDLQMAVYADAEGYVERIKAIGEARQRLVEENVAPWDES